MAQRRTMTALDARRDRSAAGQPRMPLRLRPGMSFDEWAAVGKRLARVSSASAWALGDWLVFGECAYGHRYRAALAITDLDYQTLRNYAWVARTFDVSRRRDSLSFQHHLEVTSMTEAEQDLWL